MKTKEYFRDIREIIRTDCVYMNFDSKRDKYECGVIKHSRIYEDERIIFAIFTKEIDALDWLNTAENYLFSLENGNELKKEHTPHMFKGYVPFSKLNEE